MGLGEGGVFIRILRGGEVYWGVVIGDFDNLFELKFQYLFLIVRLEQVFLEEIGLKR